MQRWDFFCHEVDEFPLRHLSLNVTQCSDHNVVTVQAALVTPVLAASVTRPHRQCPPVSLRSGAGPHQPGVGPRQDAADRPRQGGVRHSLQPRRRRTRHVRLCRYVPGRTHHSPVCDVGIRVGMVLDNGHFSIDYRKGRIVDNVDNALMLFMWWVVTSTLIVMWSGLSSAHQYTVQKIVCTAFPLGGITFPFTTNHMRTLIHIHRWAR